MKRMLLAMMFLAINLSVVFLSSHGHCQAEKQSYAQVEGDVLNEWRKPVGGVTVSLSSQTNGYSTSNLVSISDVNGHYKISNVPRYIYSAGTEPKTVDYYLTVNYPGYDLYSSETFNFKDSLLAQKNIRLKSSVVKK